MDEELEEGQEEQAPPPKKRKKGDFGEEFSESMNSAMTPMIDIVFQLLIFFLLTMKFSTNEKRLQSYLPTDKGQMAVPHKNTEDEVEDVRIRLVLQQNGQVDCLVNEHSIGSLDDEGARLTSVLMGMKSQIKDTKITIDGDREVTFQDVARALNAGLKADYREITFAMPQDLYQWRVYR